MWPIFSAVVSGWTAAGGCATARLYRQALSYGTHHSSRRLGVVLNLPARQGSSNRPRRMPSIHNMKIGVIAHLKHAIREPYAGGLEMHTRFLCEQLQKRRHAVTLFAARGTDMACTEPVCDPIHDNADSFATEHGIYGDLMNQLQNADFDIVHRNSLHYLPIAMASVLPMPMVTTLHTPPFWEMEGSLR